MTSLHIKDLSLDQRLDREGARAVRGADSRLADPGIAPGGCVTPPWALPDFPLLPAWFDVPVAPGWCGTPTPQPQGPRVPISLPGDPALMQ